MNALDMEIRSPRRILIVGVPDSGAVSFLKTLTGSVPPPRTLNAAQQSHPPASNATVPDAETSVPRAGSRSPPTTLECEASNETKGSSIAGLTHSLRLENAYYKATIPIWVDEIRGPNVAAAEAWTSDFLEDEAADVVRAIGAWILVLRVVDTGLDVVGSLLRGIEQVLDRHMPGTDEVVKLVVGVPNGIISTDDGAINTDQKTGNEAIEDLCEDVGFWEFVDSGATGRNEFGEIRGMGRVRDALEANEWNATVADDEDEEDDDEWGGKLETMINEEDKGFTFEKVQLEKEFLDLKLDLLRPDDGIDLDGSVDETEEARQVEELERMMLKVHTFREMSAEMPESQRKQFAAKAVDDLMRRL